MKRFLAKLALFLAGLCVILNLLGVFADRIAPFDIWRDSQHRRYADLMRRQHEIQAISIGNSHSDAIDFGVLGLEGQSLARAFADPFEGERYVDSIIDDLDALEIAFITISYYTFSIDNATRERTRSVRLDLYGMLPIWEPVPGDLGNFLLGKLNIYTNLMSVARPDHWHDVFEGLPQYKPHNEVSTEAAPDGKDCAPLTMTEIEDHAAITADRNVTVAHETVQARAQLYADAIDAVGATIEQLQAEGVRVILFTPPYYQTYSREFEAHAPEVLAEMYEAVARLQAKYQVEYFDYSHHPAIVGNHELFLNSDHLNDCGSEIFTAYIATELFDHESGVS